MSEPPTDPPPDYDICPDCGQVIIEGRRHYCPPDPADDEPSANFEGESPY